MRYWVKLYESGKFDPTIGIANERSSMCSVVSDRDISVITEFLTSPPNSSRNDVHNALKEDGASFSVSTTRNAIHAAGFVVANPRVVPLVTDVNKKLRQELCLDLVTRNEDFNDVIFSDESSVKLNQYNQHGHSPAQAQASTEVTCLRWH